MRSASLVHHQRSVARTFTWFGTGRLLTPAGRSPAAADAGGRNRAVPSRNPNREKLPGPSSRAALLQARSSWGRERRPPTQRKGARGLECGKYRGRGAAGPGPCAAALTGATGGQQRPPKNLRAATPPPLR